MKYAIGTAANLLSCVLYRLYRLLPRSIAKTAFVQGTLLFRFETWLEDLMIKYDDREDPIW